MSKRTKILLIILCAVVLALLAWALWRSRPFADQEPAAEEAQATASDGLAVAADVSFNILPPILPEGEAGYLVAVTSEKVRGIEMILEYDDSAVDIELVPDGDFDDWPVSSVASGQIMVTAIKAPAIELTSAENGVVICEVKVNSWIADEVVFTISSDNCTIATDSGTMDCGDSTILLRKETAQ